MFDIKSNPYFTLMRLHNLTGAWLLLWPCLWSVTLASSSMLQLLLWSPIFIIGAIIMRSAGCIINDMVDLRLDQKVERTKNRPLASNKLNRWQAFKLLCILLSIGFLILLTMGKLSLYLGLIAMLLAVIYPFAKYFISCPQLILGLAFNFGALIGWSAVKHEITLAPILLYMGGFCWIIYYDTIYAHQDKEDDVNAKVYSAALTPIGSKKWLEHLYRFVIIFCAFAGVLSKVNICYYILLTIIIILLHKQLKKVDLDNAMSCMKAFQFNSKIGFMIFIGAFLGKIHEFI